MSKGDETRQFIIEKAAPIFNTKGIEATAMSDIMNATKLSKGSLYVHFKNKEALVEHVLAHNLNLLHKKVATAISNAYSEQDKLFAYIDVLTDMSNPPVTGGCPIMNFGIEADDTNPVINGKINKEIKNAVKIISDIILQGKKTGAFKADWNHTEFSMVMFAMLEGGIIMSRIEGTSSYSNVISKTLKNMITDQRM